MGKGIGSAFEPKEGDQNPMPFGYRFWLWWLDFWRKWRW